MLRGIVFSLLICYVASEVIAIQRDGTHGEDVVNGVISYLKRSCVFDDSLLYLRRAAYVGTDDGNDSSTYGSPFAGGIWKVIILKIKCNANDITIMITTVMMATM